MTRLLSREQADRFNAWLVRTVTHDSVDMLLRDINIADRLEREDWHVDTEGRQVLIDRARRLGWDVVGDDLDEKFVNLF